MKQEVEKEFILDLWLEVRSGEAGELKRQDGHGSSKLLSFLRASRVNVPCP